MHVTDMLPPPAAFYFPLEINTDLVKYGASVRTFGRSVHLLKLSEMFKCDFYSCNPIISLV